MHLQDFAVWPASTLPTGRAAVHAAAGHRADQQHVGESSEESEEIPEKDIPERAEEAVRGGRGVGRFLRRVNRRSDLDRRGAAAAAPAGARRGRDRGRLGAGSSVRRRGGCGGCAGRARDGKGAGGDGQPCLPAAPPCPSLFRHCSRPSSLSVLPFSPCLPRFASALPTRPVTLPSSRCCAQLKPGTTLADDAPAC